MSAKPDQASLEESALIQVARKALDEVQEEAKKAVSTGVSSSAGLPSALPEKLNDALAKVRLQLVSVNAELKDQAQKLEAADKANDDLRKALATAKQATHRLQETLDASKKQCSDLSGDLYTKRMETEEKDAQIAKLKKERGTATKSLKDEKSFREGERQGAWAKQTQLTEQLADAKSKLREATNDLAATKKRLERLQNDIREGEAAPSSDAKAAFELAATIFEAQDAVNEDDETDTPEQAAGDKIGAEANAEAAGVAVLERPSYRAGLEKLLPMAEESLWDRINDCTAAVRKASTSSDRAAIKQSLEEKKAVLKDALEGLLGLRETLQGNRLDEGRPRKRKRVEE